MRVRPSLSDECNSLHQPWTHTRWALSLLDAQDINNEPLPRRLSHACTNQKTILDGGSRFQTHRLHFECRPLPWSSVPSSHHSTRAMVITNTYANSQMSLSSKVKSGNGWMDGLVGLVVTASSRSQCDMYYTYLNMKHVTRCCMNLWSMSVPCSSWHNKSSLCTWTNHPYIDRLAFSHNWNVSTNHNKIYFFVFSHNLLKYNVKINRQPALSPS